MKISDDYIGIEQLEKKPQEGFQMVEVQDNFTYKGRVFLLPARPVYIGNETVQLGDIVIFAKYSPDTHEIEEDGKKFKMVKTSNILLVL